MLKRLEPSSSDTWKRLILWICKLLYGKKSIGPDRINQIEENKKLIRTPQSECQNVLSYLQFRRQDVQDAIANAEFREKNVSEFNTRAPNLKLITDSESFPGPVRVFTKKLSESEMFTLENGVITTPSGLKAIATYNSCTGKICIFYSATEFSLKGRGPKTMLADAQIASGGVHRMYCEAVILAAHAKEAFGKDNVSLSGHSLGGSLCQFASASLQIPGIALNPAAINENLLLGLPPGNLSWARRNGLQITVQGDIVSGRMFTGRNKGRCVQLFEQKLVLPYEGKGNAHRASALRAAFDSACNPSSTGASS
jgi:hypothetical protein